MKLAKNETMEKIEEMGLFFKNRVDGYDAHMLTEIEGADAFYPFTASLLPAAPQAAVLDLGCGTGLELDAYFRRNPAARVTGLDLSEAMLNALRAKHPDAALTLVRGSYFDLAFGEAVFDAAVSVESLHHFTAAEKRPLYEKLVRALRPGGYFILTDYFAPSDAEEAQMRAEYDRLKTSQALPEGVFYHYDTPLTVRHETEVLHEAGFRTVEILNAWECTSCLKCCV